jgi:signal transduction histidine kinase
MTHALPLQIPDSRVETLLALGVRNSVPEPCFESLIRLSVEALRVPIAKVSFLDGDLIWVKASIGWEESPYPVAGSLCQFVTEEQGVLAVEDVHADKRFNQCGMVLRHPELVAYAGAPIAYRGQVVGTVSVFDLRRRAFSEMGRSILLNIATVAAGLLESRMSQWLLQQKDAQSRAFSKLSSDWMWATDRNDRYVWIKGASFEAKIGRPAEAFVGKEVLGGPIVDLLGQPVAPALTFAQVLGARRPFHGLFVQVNGASGPLIVSRTGAPQMDEAGSFAGYFGVSTDVTALAQANKRWLEATALREAAERANRAKTAFLARASHEFRTPLNAIMGFAQLLLLRSDALTPVQKGQVERIQVASERLLSLTNDMLDVGRIENGVFSFNTCPVVLATIVRAAAVLLHGNAQQRKIALQIDLPDDLRVSADARALEQVVANLLSNAIKYNQSGGHVRVWAEALPEAVLLHVEDSGRGLSKSQLARLYEPFNRLGAEETETPGNGLGLVISKGLVEAMGGSIAVNSEQNVGTRFSIRLPSAGAAPEVFGAGDDL